MYYRRRPFFLAPAMIILYITLFLLLGVYFLGVFFFQSHYLPNTTVGNIECGLKVPSYVEEITSSQIGRYSLLVTDRKENLFVIEGKEFGYQYVQLGEEQEILENQNPFMWPIALFEPSTYTLSKSVSYDEAQLEYIVTHLGLFKEDYIEKPVNAYLELGTSGYTIVPEKDGNSPLVEQVKTEIFDAVRYSQETLVLSDACYETPELHSSSAVILDAASTIDKYLNSVITYNIWDTQPEVFGKEEIMSAIRVDENYQVSLDTKVFDKFAQSLANKYNTYADKREFKTHLGDTIIIGGGDYGWVINKSKEAAEILKNLNDGAPVTREPIWSQTAYADGPNDIGNTYIEVDYTNQTLYYYKEGELILQSKFVSGSINEGWASPDGVYDINYKDCKDYHDGKQIPLSGADYRSYVDYFIVFARNIGFHDASWRKAKEFGGTTYINDGSHGCINMPLDSVKELFSKVSNGTPIVAYYRQPVEVYLHEYAYSYVKPAEPENAQ